MYPMAPDFFLVPNVNFPCYDISSDVSYKWHAERSIAFQSADTFLHYCVSAQSFICLNLIFILFSQKLSFPHLWTVTSPSLDALQLVCSFLRLLFFFFFPDIYYKKWRPSSSESTGVFFPEVLLMFMYSHKMFGFCPIEQCCSAYNPVKTTEPVPKYCCKTNFSHPING